MQRRCNSANIVIHPSAPKRKQDLISVDVSSCNQTLDINSKSTFCSSEQKHKRIKSCVTNVVFSDSSNSEREAPWAKYPSPVSQDGHSGHSTCVTSDDGELGSALDLPKFCISTQKHQASLPCATSHTALVVPRLLKEPRYILSYAESLIKVSSAVAFALWPSTTILQADALGMPHPAFTTLTGFVTETVSRSRTSLSTLQLALLYCLQSKRDQVAKLNGGTFLRSSPQQHFLIALISASKYLQDKNFSNKAWSKISSVPVRQINTLERQFLHLRKWTLHVEHDTFQYWSRVMESAVSEFRDTTIFGDLQPFYSKWATLIGETLLLHDNSMTGVVNGFSSFYRTFDMNPLLCPVQLDIPTAILKPESDHVIGTTYIPDASLITPTAETDEWPGNETGNEATCPFFDEFVQMTPPDSISSSAEQVCTPPEIFGLESQYLTPESMRTNSPGSLSCMPVSL